MLSSQCWDICQSTTCRNTCTHANRRAFSSVEIHQSIQGSAVRQFVLRCNILPLSGTATSSLQIPVWWLHHARELSLIIKKLLILLNLKTISLTSPLLSPSLLYYHTEMDMQVLVKVPLHLAPPALHLGSLQQTQPTSHPSSTNPHSFASPTPLLQTIPPFFPQSSFAARLAHIWTESAHANNSSPIANTSVVDSMRKDSNALPMSFNTK